MKGMGKSMTLGARLRMGIGEVSSKGVPTGLMGRLRQTSVHYVRCVKPNDSMAAYGFEQQRVLLQLQCSGVLEMVRIRRQGFPSRMKFKDFEARFAPLLVEPRGRSEPGLIEKGFNMLSMMKAASEKSEKEQASAEEQDAAKKGHARALTILKRANLFEHRHYAFGKTMVFLRNGVEGALIAAVQKQMLAITWFQKEARKRVQMRKYAYARKVVVRTQANLRRNHARTLVRRRLAHIRKRIYALRMGYFAVRIARWVERRTPAFLARRRKAAITCQRFARGFLGKKKLKKLIFLANRGHPANRLRWARRMVTIQRLACVLSLIHI